MKGKYDALLAVAQKSLGQGLPIRCRGVQRDDGRHRHQSTAPIEDSRRADGRTEAVAAHDTAASRSSDCRMRAGGSDDDGNWREGRREDDRIGGIDLDGANVPQASVAGPRVTDATSRSGAIKSKGV